MTTTSPAAVAAAREALDAHTVTLAPMGSPHPVQCRCGWAGQSEHEHRAAAAVDAAAPHLLATHEAEVRARVAAEIADMPYPDSLEGRFIVDWQEGFDYAQSLAEHIAMPANPTTTED